MAKFRVWNENKYDYKETFKGDPILIKAGRFVEMEEDDAIMFRGTFAPPVFDADGNHTEAGFKKIRLEKITSTETESAPKAESNDCLVCKYKASSPKDLEEHAKMHADLLVEDEEIEKELKNKRKAG